MPKLVDQYGNAIDAGALREPQTSRIGVLENSYLTPMLAGLTPARLACTLRDADNGDLLAQHRLFADMEERDAHLACELGKRKLALMSLDWSIEPPRNASAAEKDHAEWLEQVLEDAVDPLEDLLLALMDGVGHGFAAVELIWRQEGGELLPVFAPRPQEWFQLDRTRRDILLRDDSGNGMPLRPFGWVFHTHGKAKTGYIGRMGLHRVLAWPFLYKAYALGDFAEFLETYGLPIIVGKYFNGASADEKASLMRAVSALGHDARAIMPADMSLEVQKVTGGAGAGGGSHLDMIDWADRAQSKAILGQTTSAEAKATGMGSGIADLHGDVRDDILRADALQIAGTLTRDLLYPLIALNRGNIDGLRRCPRLVFDTGEAEDLTAYAEALPKLVQAGMRSIPVRWVHEKLRIPEPADGEATLGNSLSTVDDNETAPPPADKNPPHAAGVAADENPSPLAGEGQGRGGTALAALAAEKGDSFPDQHALDALPDPSAALLDGILAPIMEALAAGLAPEEIVARMAEWYPRMDDAALTEMLARAMFVADLHGRYSAQAERGRG